MVAVFAIGQQEEPKRLRGTLQNLSTFAASLKSRLVSQAVKTLFSKKRFAKRQARSNIEALMPQTRQLSKVYLSAFYTACFGTSALLSILKKKRSSRRADSRVGTVVIEYKQPSALTTQADERKAHQQLSEYITSISLELENEAIGFLTFV